MVSIQEYTKPLAGSALFTPFQIGDSKLEHRIVMAPLTRMRATYLEQEDISVPNDLMVEYYSQRTTKGGLLISEAIPISRHAAGFPKISGIFTNSQIEGWKRITNAVHAKGGFIYCQLWHVGRATTPSLISGQVTMSSSNIPISGHSAVTGEAYADAPPKAMTQEDMNRIITEFVQAAKNALSAGFDGIEIHGANGYLLDQFLHDNVNNRTDAYGGTAENRARFPLEVLAAVTSAVGASKTGIRLSPFNYYQDTKSSDPMSHWRVLCDRIATLCIENRPAYVHMVEPRFDEKMSADEKLASLPEASQQYSITPFAKVCRKAGIKFLTAGGFTRETCVAPVHNAEADAVVFGRLFICNPDLVNRLSKGSMFNKQDRSTFYWANVDKVGYVDYPSLEEERKECFSLKEGNDILDALGNLS